MQVQISGKSRTFYNIEEHKHRFAVLAASRGASTITVRFSVKQGTYILETICLNNRNLAHPDQLPSSSEIDVAHRRWRRKAIKVAGRLGLPFTHGVAAKLINIYCKSRFVCGGFNKHPSVKALHPPVDSVLLAALAEKDFGGKRTVWREAQKKRWTKFGSEDYEKVIQAIRHGLECKPLWLIEEHWQLGED